LAGFQVITEGFVAFQTFGTLAPDRTAMPFLPAALSIFVGVFRRFAVSN
jgi:hypothetical protein